MEEMHSTRCRERTQSFLVLVECIALPESSAVHQPRSSLNSVLLGFYGGFTTYTWLSLVTSDKTKSPAPFPSLEVVNGTESSNSLITGWFPWQPARILRLPTAAAKSLQWCPTLRDPIDGSPTGSSFPGILQARTLEWVAISFSNAWKWKVKVKSLSCVRLCETPWTAAYQALLSMGFSRQEYWSGVPLPSPLGYLGAAQKCLINLIKETFLSHHFSSKVFTLCARNGNEDQTIYILYLLVLFSH